MTPLWKVINIHMCAYTYTFTFTYTYTYTYTYTCTCTCTCTCTGTCACACACLFLCYYVLLLLPLRVVVEEGEEGGHKPKQSQLIPSAVILRIAETEQLYQAQRMFGGIGNVMLSTYSQTGNGEDPLVSLVNL